MASENNQDPGKREPILLAAEQVFAKRGFKGTTTREVAQQAGIASSLIFYYFKNKAALYEIAVDLLKEGRREAMFREVDPPHYIHSFIGMNFFYFVAGPGFEAVGAEDPYGPEEVEKRKKEVWRLLRSSLM